MHDPDGPTAARVWPSTLWLEHIRSCDRPRKCTHPPPWPHWWLLMAKRGVPFHPDSEVAFQLALQRVAGYRGQGLEPRIGDFVRAIVVDSLVGAPQPVTPGWVHISLMSVRALVLWAQRTGEPITREHLLSAHTRSRFLTIGALDVSASSRANYRSRLDIIATIISGVPIASTCAIPYRRSDPVEPLTANEISTLWTWGNGIRPATRRDRIVATLVLGLGCGLRAAEMVTVTADHITVDDHGVHVSATSCRGETRLVTCDRIWEDRLLDVVAATPAGHPLTSPWRAKPSGAVTLQNAMASAQHAFPPPVWFSPRSLRNTWVVARLTAGVPMPTLLQAAGVESLDAMRVFLPFVPEPTPALRAALLRGDA